MILLSLAGICTDLPMQKAADAPMKPLLLPETCVSTKCLCYSLGVVLMSYPTRVAFVRGVPAFSTVQRRVVVLYCFLKGSSM
jgi:hypothetical protein